MRRLLATQIVQSRSLSVFVFLSLGTVALLGCGGKASEDTPSRGGSGGEGAAAGSGGAAGASGMGGPGMGGTGMGGTGMGGTGTGGTGMGGTAGSGGDACTTCVVPPDPPQNAPSGDGPGAVFTINKLYYGDTDRDGVPSSSAWKSFGYDIDGFQSTKDSTFHCKPASEANPATVKTDGNDGIDNAYGANIVPVLLGLESGLSNKVNEAIAEGSFATIFAIDTLGGGTSYADLPASFFVGGTLPELPAWDGTDAWPLRCEHMTDCQDQGTLQIAEGNGSLVRFPSSYVVDGQWVSGPRGDVLLSFPVFAFIDLERPDVMLRRAVVTMDLGAGNPPTSATHGTISGILDTEEFIDRIVEEAGFISTSLCSGPTLDSITTQIRTASDIMADGTQDPTQTCNGISLGLGFEAKAAQLGIVLDKRPPVEDPCAGM